MDDDEHQQLMEDLANDFLCRRSSFVLTTDPPRRRRRQRPERAESHSPAARCSSLDSQLVRSPIGPPVIARPAQKSQTVLARAPVSSVEAIGIRGKRMKDPTFQGASSNSSKGVRPQTPNALAIPNPTRSPKHDLMCASNQAISPFARKFLWTHQSRPDAPPAHAPISRRVIAECTSRAHSGDTVPAAAADTSEHAIPRAHSEPLREPTKNLLHWAQRPAAKNLLHCAQRPVELQQETSRQQLQAALTRATSLRNISAGLQNPKPKKFKVVAHAVMAAFSMRAPPPLGRSDSEVTNTDVAMLAWEHSKRLALGRRRSGEDGAHGAVDQAHFGPAEKPASSTSSDALLRESTSRASLKGSTSRALSLIRETGLGLTSRAGV